MESKISPHLSPTGAGRVFVLCFEDAEAGEARIAGAAAAAHAAAQAGQAGAREILVATGDGAPLSAQAWNDIHRAAPNARPWIANGVAPHLSISGRVLVRAAALRRFADGDAAALRWRDETIATNPDGQGVVQAGDAEAVDAAAADASRWVLRGTAKPGDGLVSRLLNRPVSQAVSRVLLRIPGVRPWHMTVVTAAIGLIMLLALLWGGYAGLVAGGLLFHFASVVDGVDGEIARATYRSSARGATLDTMVDMATNLSFYVGFTSAVTRLYGPKQALIGGMSLVLALFGLGMMIWLARRIGEPGSFDFIKRYYRMKCPTGLPRLIINTFITLMSRDTFAFVWAFFILFHAPLLITYGLAFFATLWVVLILIAAPPLLREGLIRPVGSLVLEQSR